MMNSENYSNALDVVRLLSQFASIRSFGSCVDDDVRRLIRYEVNKYRDYQEALKWVLAKIEPNSDCEQDYCRLLEMRIDEVRESCLRLLPYRDETASVLIERVGENETEPTTLASYLDDLYHALGMI